MEERYHTASAGTADYAAYDRVWQRVAPELDPYPEIRSAGGGEQNALLELPGAEGDPCCMGSEAKHDIQVIRGFIESEEQNQRYFTRLACSVREKQGAVVLRRIAGGAAEHLRQLMAVYYLVMGECWKRQELVLVTAAEGYCDALRRAYHEKSCAAFNYLRAADAAGDVCLQELFRTFAQEEREHARQLLNLLSRRM